MRQEYRQSLRPAPQHHKSHGKSDPQAEKQLKFTVKLPEVRLYIHLVNHFTKYISLGQIALVVEFMYDLTFFHNQDPITQVEQFLNFIRSNNHRHLFFRKSAYYLVNLRLGANIYASGRLVKKDNLKLAGKPFSNNYLLLVAAAQIYNLLPGCFAFDLKISDDLLDERPYRSLIDDAMMGALSQLRQCNIIADGTSQGQALCLSVLRNKANV